MRLKNLFTFSLLVSFEVMLSCDCKTPASVPEEIKKSDIVIHAKIIKAQYEKTLNQSNGYLDTLSKKIDKKIASPTIVNEYTVLVKKKFKGIIENDTIVIRTRLDPVSDCGLILKANTDYIFYAYKITNGSHNFDNEQKPLFTTSACTRTKQYSKKEIKKINRSIR